MQLRLSYLTLAAAGLLALLVGLAVAGSSDAQRPSPEAEKRSKSAALKSAPKNSNSPLQPSLRTAEDRRAAGASLAAPVPIPEGSNFNGIHWEDLEDATQADVESVLQFNAACQWVRAYKDGRDPAVSGEVLDDIAEWPALRGTFVGEAAAQVAGDVRAGRRLRSDNDLVVGCTQAYTEDVQHARAKGLPAPR